MYKFRSVSQRFHYNQQINEPTRSYIHSFEVALTNGKCIEADVQLAMSVQFGDDCIVRNTKLSTKEDGSEGAWGEDERDENLDAYTATNPIVTGM